MNLKGNYFSKQECERIHEMSLKVLEEMGCFFDDDYALEVFKKAGAIVEGNVVKMPSKLVNDALKTCPSSFEVYGRNGKKITVGGDNQIIAPESGALNVLDEHGIHRNLAIDFLNFQKLHHNSTLIDIMNPNLIEPSDIPREIVRDYQMAVCLKYSDKPMIGLTTSVQDTINSIEMTQKFIGREDNVIIGIISVISPCKYDKTMLDALKICVERNQPIMVACCSQPGATSPVSVFGTLVIDNAQVLAGIVYAQLLKPGAEILYGNTTGGCDLRHASPAIGSAETSMFIFGSAAMCRYYNIPCRTGGSLADAKAINWQNGVESTITLLPAIMSTSNFILHSCGLMDSFNMLSYAKFILDEQNIEMFRYMVKGKEILVDDETIKEELQNIIEAGPGGQFLDCDHTLENFREHLYTPVLFNKMGYASYVNIGSPSVEENALKLARKRIENYVYPEITKEQEDILRSYIGDLIDTI
ncbi:hypothetical protein AN639_00035 [Candidatus Epulonipiscium fishelsonii]|uniref:Uncharacterized protein n=2 Tax=Candidatus Epulonipiscium fishelsonii TaxID=77094 RepID=A0ACC8XCH8_9FIRM|nr:hypothetical protein AN396_05960 [Epulopiscium sp. SCG-B11WGA-EpuloA1]ONI41605.1 hypothetical protein AN396_03345 [Epulopiscium sp. SCG-B11WGA-EpuloA1]ONI43917.1 hypothetical protein AN639_00035 [Epulopiscium sp. SCG-B05WGA-EpuloA1]